MRAASAAPGSPPVTTRASTRLPTARRCCKRRDADKDQTYFLHGVPRAHFGQVLFPLGELRQGRGARARPPRRAAGASTSRQHRHLLHRRAAVPRVPRGYLPERPGRSRPPRRAPRHARGLPFYTLGQRAGLHIGGRARFGRGTLVRRPQGCRAQRAHRGAGTRTPEALETRALRTGPMNWLCGTPAGEFAHRREGAPPSARPGGKRTRAAGRHDSRRLRRAAARRGAGPVRGVLRRDSAASAARSSRTLYNDALLWGRAWCMGRAGRRGS